MISKLSRLILVIFLLSVCVISANAQRFKAGFYSGINFSDLHGQEYGGKWSPLTGPSEGIVLKYRLSKPFTIVSGLGYASFNYKYSSYYYPYYWDKNYYPLYNSIIAPVRYSSVSNFSFTRVPLMLELNIPSSVGFHIAAGGYFAFLNHTESATGFMNYYAADNFSKKDKGLIFSAGGELPVSGKLVATFDVNYVSGKKTFIENYNARHGYSEFTFGLSYRFTQKDGKNPKFNQNGDTSSSKVLLGFFAGPSVSWIKYKEGKGGYLPFSGHNIGFSLSLPLKGGSALTTGAYFQRSGYAISDSSNSYYLINGDSKRSYYVDTKTSVDRLVIPFLFDIPVGKSQRIFISTGPYIDFKLNGRNSGTVFSELRYESGYNLRKLTVTDDMEKVMTDFDAGWIFGLNSLFPLKSGYSLELGISYLSCFSEFYEKKSLALITSPAENGSDMKPRILALNLGIVFPALKKEEGKR